MQGFFTRSTALTNYHWMEPIHIVMKELKNKKSILKKEYKAFFFRKNKNI